VAIAVLAILIVTAGLVSSRLGGGGPQSSGATRPQEAAAADHGPAGAGVPQLDMAAYRWDYTWGLDHPGADAPGNRSVTGIMVDLNSRHVVWQRDPHRRMAVASTAKLMTAMVTLDNAAPDKEIVVPEAATKVEPDVMGLTAGEKITINNVLYGLLLDSGNDAAETLAETTMGRPRFIAAMNEKAKAMGLENTHFANPSGLDDPDQYSDAQDLATIAAYLYHNYPLLEQVATTREVSITGNDDHKAFGPINFNKLLWTYEGSIGFKTGLTDDAGTCLVTGAHRGDRTLLLVELNDPLIFTDAAGMLDYGFRQQQA
jgi:D-alanyl-D-alanine carboxypeptidase